MRDTVSIPGTIQFEPENKTKKHIAQAAWKKVAMVIFKNDISDYYSWFIKKRFNLELYKIHREPHITFINDAFENLNNRLGTSAEKEKSWNQLKEKWDGQSIDVTLNLRPFSDGNNWWLIVDHKCRKQLHDIRLECGLGLPYFGLHMTFGNLTPQYYENGQQVFDKNYEHSKYINLLNEKGWITMNKDYTSENEIYVRRIRSERCDLYSPKEEIIGSIFNEYELNDVRIQVAKKQVEGYYIMWKEHKIPIEKDGRIENWPEGFYDMIEKQLVELFKIQKEEK